MSARSKLSEEESQRTATGGRSRLETGAVVHAMRVRVKTLRALLRVTAPGLKAADFARADQALRAIGGGLAGERDQAVIKAVLEGVLEELPRGQRARASFLLNDQHFPQAGREQTMVQVRLANTKVRRVMQTFPLGHLEAGTLRTCAELGLRKLYRKTRRKMRRAARSGTSDDFHAWRKQTKYLSLGSQSLRGQAQDPAGSKLAARLDRLQKGLGIQHDLALAELWIRERFDRANAAVRPVLRLLRRHRARWEEKVLRLGQKCFRLKSREFAARMLDPEPADFTLGKMESGG